MVICSLHFLKSWFPVKLFELLLTKFQMEWNAGLSTLFVDNLKLKMSSLDSRHYNRSITKKLLNLLVSYLGEYLVFDLKLKT